MTKLSISGLVVNRAALPVVQGVDVAVESGKISVLLGANGAGKTTFLEAVSGIIRSEAGRIEIDGVDLAARRPGDRFRDGLSHVEQGRTVFRELTTHDNLRVASRTGGSLDDAYALFPELLQRRDVRAGLLSGGEQQMLVIARALLGRPKALLIDEMSAGLAPVVVRRLMTAVRRLADAGLAVVLVEQFAALALAIGDRAYVLRRGRVVYDGECAPLAADLGRLHDLYLGVAQSA
jgi:branched-chain amino acid transport system ATP-binding protein